MRKDDTNFQEPLINKKETARLLGISIRTLERLILAGQMRIVPIGRRVMIRPSEVKQFIATHEVQFRP